MLERGSRRGTSGLPMTAIQILDMTTGDQTMRSSELYELAGGNGVAYMSETTSIQEDTAFDVANEVKAGRTICNTISSFKDASFTRTLRNLRSLEIPAPFVKRHGGNFQARVVLQGPSGRLTAVHLTLESSRIQDRVLFRGPEWRHFLLENMLKVGRELVFSLVSKLSFTVHHSGAANGCCIDQEFVDRPIEKSKLCGHDKKQADLVPESSARLVDEVPSVYTAIDDDDHWASRGQIDVPPK